MSGRKRTKDDFDGIEEYKFVKQKFNDSNENLDYYEESRAYINFNWKQPANPLQSMLLNSKEKKKVLRSHDFSDAELKPDHEKRPLYVLPNNVIFLEAFSPFYKSACDFLIAIAEPRSRPSLMHEFEITPSSLYSAVTLKYTTEKIVYVLEKLSKTVKIPSSVKKFIAEHADSYGRARCVLANNKYYIESEDKEIIDRIKEIEQVKVFLERQQQEKENEQKEVDDLEMKVEETVEKDTVESTPAKQNTIANSIDTRSVGTQKENNKGYGMSFSANFTQNSAIRKNHEEDLAQYIERIEKEDFIEFEKMLEDPEEDEAAQKILEEEEVYRVEIPDTGLESIRRTCNDMHIPLKQEYDYQVCNQRNPPLNLRLKATTIVRQYQAKALAKMFANKRAQSGIIVLPCGAGKSLLGISAACIVRKRTIVFCNSNHSVRQWKYQFRTWAELFDAQGNGMYIDDKSIVEFVSKSNTRRFSSIKERIFDEKPLILITTYNMMYGTNSADSKEIRKQLQSLEWGLAILDEVHVVPANTFKEAINAIKAHCKLGLTATLLREDNKIDNLEYLIGPKLYEESWKDLVDEGFLARVLCAEIRCEMNKHFMKEYQRQKEYWKKTLLYLANPEKFFVLQYLIRYHEARKDKILVFSDNIFLLTKYAKLLNRLCLHGKISHDERNRVLDFFQKDDKCNCLFISRIGDTSIDLPDANVLIQISGFFGSRRQEAQRLGRILRPKDRSKARYNAFFYTIVSLQTEETYFSQKRQTYLINQGFSFRVLSNNDFCFAREPVLKSTFKLGTDKEQYEFLIEVLTQEENSKQTEELDEDTVDVAGNSVVVESKNRSAMAGAGFGLYFEY